LTGFASLPTFNRTTRKRAGPGSGREQSAASGSRPVRIDRDRAKLETKQELSPETRVNSTCSLAADAESTSFPMLLSLTISSPC
jgi:hypothetical protein